MINAPEIEFLNPFDAQTPDEEANLAAMTRSLRRANGFGLIFAVCNQSDLRERLMRDLASRLPEKKILQLPIRQPIDSLYHYLTETWETQTLETPLDAVFVYGLESWLPAYGDEPGARFVSNLNLFRDNFPKVLSCPLVLWIPQHILTEIQDRAPDFASVRSGVYVFALTSETRSHLLTNYISEELTAIAGLTLEEKKERIETLSHLLKEYQSLPDDRRNLLDEARLMTSLATTYHEVGRFDEAEPLLKDVLQIFCVNFPSNYTDTAAALSNLALFYSIQGRYSEAEPLYKEALRIERFVSQTQSNGLIVVLADLAILYSKQKRYNEAKPLLEEALIIAQSSVISNILIIADISNALGNLYSDTGYYKKSEELHKQALEMRRTSLPPDHPAIGSSLNNLAGIYTKQGKYKEATSILQKALKITETSFGHEHLDTLKIAGNYATLLAIQGQYEQARDLIARFPLVLERISFPILEKIMQTKAH